MLRRLAFSTLASAALLSGCAGTRNRSLDSVHQPVVQRTDYTFDVAAGGPGAGGGLAPGEARRLDGWLGALRLAYGDKVSVDDPSGDGAARAAVGAVVARYGLLLADAAPVTAEAIPQGVVRVVVSRSVARVPGCPDYSRVGGTQFNSDTSSNYGCATNSNLALMVADPSDLVRGQPGSGTADPATSYRAIDAYRQAKPSGGGGASTGNASTGGSK